jgi:hypothetical protein
VAALLFLHIILSPFADEMTAEETTAATMDKLGLACGRRLACRRRGRAWPRARAPPPWPSSASRVGGSWSSALISCPDRQISAWRPRPAGSRETAPAAARHRQHIGGLALRSALGSRPRPHSPGSSAGRPPPLFADLGRSCCHAS